MFLRHQAGNGRYAFIIVDGLERLSPAVLRELEAVSQLRLRNRPLVYFLLLTRNEDLVANLLPQYNGGPLARGIHQRLNGFTLEETRGYVHASLRGAGCDWAEELIPDDVIVDIQAFTQGVVGDINCDLPHEPGRRRRAHGRRQPAAESHARASQGGRYAAESALRRHRLGAGLRRGAVAGRGALERPRASSKSRPRA